MSNRNDPNYDRIDRNESDGMTFYGYDSDDGTTSWYDETGILNSVTETPSDDDIGW